MSNNRQYLFDGIKISLAYIGTVVGAGFATGQEILHFFTHYGYASYMGVAVSTWLFIIVGRKIMLLGYKLKAKSYGTLVDYVFGFLAPVVNIYLGISFILFCAAMFAGGAALFYEQFDIPYIVGAFLTAVFTLCVILNGMDGIYIINSLVVPSIIAFCILILIFTLGQVNLTIGQPVFDSIDFLSTIKSSIAYASFNIILSIGVLVPMGSTVKDVKSINIGSALGGGLLGLLIAINNFSLLQHIPDVFNREIPMLLIVEKMGSILPLIFSLIAWTEILSTAVANLFAVNTIIQDKSRGSTGLVAITITITSLIICFLGFSNIVTWFYPILGVIGFALICIILLKTT